MRRFRGGEEKNQPIAGSDVLHLDRIARIDERDDARVDANDKISCVTRISRASGPLTDR
jgi:hypothetical protein